MSDRVVLPPSLMTILRESGADWRCERCRRHWQLIVNGRVVLTFPPRWKENKGRRTQNALACVRRAVNTPKEIKA